MGMFFFYNQTKFDFTVCGAGLFVLLLVLICFGFVTAIVGSAVSIYRVFSKKISIENHHDNDCCKYDICTSGIC